MSDIRFIIIGVGLIFAGIIVLSVFGSEFDEITLQAEFVDCYEYHEDAPPTRINCEIAFYDKMIFFSFVILLIACGIVAMVKGPGSSFDTRDEPKDSDKTEKSD